MVMIAARWLVDGENARLIAAYGHIGRLAKEAAICGNLR